MLYGTGIPWISLSLWHPAMRAYGVLVLTFARGPPPMDAVRFHPPIPSLGMEIPSMGKTQGCLCREPQEMEVKKQYVEQIKWCLKQLIEYFPQKGLSDFCTTDLDEWLSICPWKAVTENSTRRVLISFGHWAQNDGYLPTDRDPEFNGC